MTIRWLSVFILLLLASCATESNPYSPDLHFSEKEKDAVLWLMMRYIGDAPAGVSPINKFSPSYDSSYLSQWKQTALEAWQKKGDTCYFMVSIGKPNRKERMATAGKLLFNESGELKIYAEIFRTSGMAPDTLTKRSLVLFDKIIKGESFQQSETSSSDQQQLIELPNPSTYYDVEAREWKVRSAN